MASRSSSPRRLNVDFGEEINLMPREISEIDSHSDNDSQSGEEEPEDERRLSVKASNELDHEPNSSASASLEPKTPTRLPLTERAMSPDRHFPVRKGRHVLEVFRPWWKESIGCVVIILALLALFSVLASYQHKPQPDWPDWLSINTIVSILVIVLKTAILSITAEGLAQMKYNWFLKPQRLIDLEVIDAASRGRLDGSLRLLLSLKAKQLALSLGAIVVLITTIVEPFSQQLIKYYNCPRQESAQASISRANLFNVTGGHTGPGAQSVPLEFSKAIFNGFYAVDNIKQHQWASFECPSGNCTFTPFTTVALCSECFDVTRRIKTTCPIPLNVTDVGISGNDKCWRGPLYRETATSLPVPGVPSWFGSMTQYPFSNGLCSEINYCGNVKPLTPWELPIHWCQYSIGYSRRQPNCSGDAGPNSAPTFGNRDYQSNKCLTATECHLYPCLRTISSAVNRGVLTETIHSSRPLLFDYHGYGSVTTLVNDSCLTTKERTQLDPCYTLEKADTTWGTFNFTAHDSCLDKQDKLPQRCTYVFDWYSWKSFGLMNIMDGNLSQYGNDPTATSGPSGTQVTFNEGNFDVDTIGGHMQNIADSFTGYMHRSAPEGFGHPASGVTTQFETCIAIRWGWYAAPVTCAIAAIAFYVAICWHLVQEGGWRYNWKSSIVALMLHGLQPVGELQLGGNQQRLDEGKEEDKTSDPTRERLDSIFEIRHVARNNLAQFTEREPGWAFQVVGASSR